MDLNAKISRELKRIVLGDKPAESMPVMSGTVISVNDGAGTCVVQLSFDDQSAPTPGIAMNVVSSNANGMIQLPKIGSRVLVGEIDGPGKLALLDCSDIDKISILIDDTSITAVNSEVKIVVGDSTMSVKDGVIQFNDGSHLGMVKVTELKGKLNAVEQDLNNLKTAFTTLLSALAATAVSAGGTPVTNAALSTAFSGPFTSYAGAMLTPAQVADLKNDKVKH